MHWPLDPAAFAAVFIFTYVAHGIGDYYVQTEDEARDKGKPGRVGRKACAAHVLSYTVVAFLAVVLADRVFALHLAPVGIFAGQAVSAVSHYWADRRLTLAAFCERIGRGGFYRLGQPRDLYACVRGTEGESVVLMQHDGIGCEQRPANWDAPHLGTGAYMLDQWWHIGWLLVAALVTVWL
jgi:hypothetical protein